MYSTRSGLILGFHGTDKSIVDKVLNGQTDLEYRENDHDWLGHGAYFWEQSPSRALAFAQLLKENPGRTKTKINEPAVIGAVLSLGNCLDLTDYKNLSLLKTSYEGLVAIFKAQGRIVPVNRGVYKTDEDLLLRELDCLVIEMLHESVGKDVFDSVKGVFWEGEELYPTAGFKEKKHIQICIRNKNCIKGFFLPRTMDENYKKV